MEAVKEKAIKKVKKRITVSGVITKILFYLLLAVLCLIFLFPVWWMVVNSLKPQDVIYRDMSSALTFLPTTSPAHWFDSYIQLFSIFSQFGRSIFNSVLYAALSITGVLVLNSLAGYALARFTFPGHNVLVTIIILILIVPVETSLVPQYVILKSLGLLNVRLLGYILPGLISPFNIFMFRSYFLGIPKELEEAAYIAGCGRLRSFFRIIIPCSLPVFATVGIFTSMGSWNEYVFAQLMFAGNPSMMPLQTYLQIINNFQPQDLSLVLASLTLSTIPIAIVYIFCQRWIIEGVAFSGLK